MGRTPQKIKEIYNESSASVSAEHVLLIQNHQEKALSECDLLEPPGMDDIDDGFSEASSNLLCPKSVTVKKPKRPAHDYRKRHQTSSSMHAGQSGLKELLGFRKR